MDKLIGMGARIVLCDPHRAVIAGPSPLRGGSVESPDIRAGMAMLLAALLVNFFMIRALWRNDVILE